MDTIELKLPQSENEKLTSRGLTPDNVLFGGFVLHLRAEDVAYIRIVIERSDNHPHIIIERLLAWRSEDAGLNKDRRIFSSIFRFHS